MRWESSNWSHRITEWLGLVETLKNHPVQTPWHGQGHLLVVQVAQSLVQPHLEHFQGGDVNNYSGKSASVKHSHLNFLPYIQFKSTLFQFQTIIPCHVTRGPHKKVSPCLYLKSHQVLKSLPSKVFQSPLFSMLDNPNWLSLSSDQEFQPSDHFHNPHLVLL